jgi:hypothetical protein
MQAPAGTVLPTMYVGPARNAAMLEMAVINDEAGEAIIHAMPARPKFLKGIRQ